MLQVTASDTKSDFRHFNAWLYFIDLPVTIIKFTDLLLFTSPNPLPAPFPPVF
jgi:hypothetical protein